MEFDPVSIKMAKEQNLNLNSLKISGMCGRLLCCLGYEYETYRYLNTDLPTPGSSVKVGDNSYSVCGTNPLRESINIRKGERIIEVSKRDLQKKENQYHLSEDLLKKIIQSDEDTHDDDDDDDIRIN